MTHPLNRLIRLAHFMAAIALLASLVAPSALAEEKNPSTKRTASKARKPLKVFILAGQSNMQPRVGYHQLANGLKDSPETKYLHDKLFGEDGLIRPTENIFYPQEGDRKNWLSKEMARKLGKSKDISKAGPKPLTSHEWYKWHRAPRSGPDLMFCVTMYEELDQPILLIKTAWGGKSLNYHFRPPIGEEWQPPKDSPDHPDNKPAPHPLPKTFSLPKDFQKPKGSQNLQICQGFPVEKMHGISPIYVNFPYPKTKHGDLKSPLKAGDLIIGLNGEGLRGDPVNRWRDLWFNIVREGDWMLDITVFRDGEIKTLTVDVARSMDGGRSVIPEYRAKRKAEKERLVKEGGEYYHRMIDKIKRILSNPGKWHPAYDPKVGYEIGGFVWFHGYNDYIASVTYPNGDKPGGYDKYSWLLSHLIRSVRKDLEEPQLPVVIGVFGQVPESHPFAQAQAQVAGFDEFKGNVVAVQTRPFVDKRLRELDAKHEAIKSYDGGDPNHPYAKAQARARAAKAGKKFRGRGERRRVEAIARLGLEDGTYLSNNKSDRGFHYHGSPKFFMRAGEAFAKALISITEDK